MVLYPLEGLGGAVTVMAALWWRGAQGHAAACWLRVAPDPIPPVFLGVSEPLWEAGK